MLHVQQTFAIGWFPSTDWALALERWPELGEDLPWDHDGYKASVESRMRAIGDRARGMRLLMVPVTVADIDQQAHTDSADADSPEVRGRAASRLAQEGLGKNWPPARNELCWCASGVKYKFCCATNSAMAPPAGPGTGTDVEVDADAEVDADPDLEPGS
ncbi:MAG: SEC-C domain-containing protein [Acidimicrobiales bacterium]